MKPEDAAAAAVYLVSDALQMVLDGTDLDALIDHFGRDPELNAYASAYMTARLVLDVERAHGGRSAGIREVVREIETDALESSVATMLRQET